MINDIIRKPYKSLKKALLKKRNAHPLEIAISQNDQFSVDNFVPLFVDYIEKNQFDILHSPEKIRSMLMIKMYRAGSTMTATQEDEFIPYKFFFPTKDRKQLNSMIAFSKEIDQFFCDFDTLIKYKDVFDCIFALQNKKTVSISSTSMTFSYLYDFLFVHIKDKICSVHESDEFKSYWQKHCLYDKLHLENKTKSTFLRL